MSLHIKNIIELTEIDIKLISDVELLIIIKKIDLILQKLRIEKIINMQTNNYNYYMQNLELLSNICYLVNEVNAK